MGLEGTPPPLHPAPSLGCSGEGLDVGSVHTAEAVCAGPGSWASALWTWCGLRPVVGVRDCPGQGPEPSAWAWGRHGRGRASGPQAEPRARAPSGPLSSICSRKALASFGPFRAPACWAHCVGPTQEQGGALSWHGPRGVRHSVPPRCWTTFPCPQPPTCLGKAACGTVS